MIHYVLLMLKLEQTLMNDFENISDSFCTASKSNLTALLCFFGITLVTLTQFFFFLLEKVCFLFQRTEILQKGHDNEMFK